MCFTDHGFSLPLPASFTFGSMNSTASQSSNSGWLGVSAWTPKSSDVPTIPVPKYACQTRFTKTRAVVGDFRSASQRAKVRRELSAPFGSGLRKDGTPPVTVLLGFSQSPRLSTDVGRSLPASKVMLVAPSGHCSQNVSSFAFASFHSGTVVRQCAKTVACWTRVRFSGGTLARMSRTFFGSGSAFASLALVALMRNRPRLLFMWSSLFQPP